MLETAGACGVEVEDPSPLLLPGRETTERRLLSPSSFFMLQLLLVTLLSVFSSVLEADDDDDEGDARGVIVADAPNPILLVMSD